MKKILTLVIALLVTGSAFADTCATSLMPAFTANQATQLCTKLGTSVAISQVPQSDNAIDLGSASKTWRTLYTGTSRIAKTSDILRVRQDSQRLFTWDASSDTAFTATFGDGGTTAAQTLVIGASTADADDDSVVDLCGGGATGASRGGCVTVSGNEGTGTGTITLSPGTASVVTIASTDMNTSGRFRSSRTSDLGWTVVNAANQACNTTCTSACVIGIDTLGTGGFLDCATATADSCLCAGAS